MIMCLFPGQGEATGVTGEGVRLGGGAHGSQSGGESNFTTDWLNVGTRCSSWCQTEHMWLRVGIEPPTSGLPDAPVVTVWCA